MRSRTLWLAAVLMAALAAVGMAVAAPDDKKEGDSGKSEAKKGGKNGGRAGRGGFQGGRGDRGVTVDQIVERLMAFDKDKDGKIAKSELPERMQDLIARGDTNKDGTLDKDEIKALATKLQAERFFLEFAGRGGRGGRGGFGPGGRGGFGPGGGLERAVDDLKLSDKKKETAEAAVKAYQENVRKLTDLARADLLLKMKEVLSDEEFKKFKEATDRRPGVAARPR
jgi:hypothetical protein